MNICSAWEIKQRLYTIASNKVGTCIIIASEKDEISKAPRQMVPKKDNTIAK
jgi:hypothetical protein